MTELMARRREIMRKVPLYLFDDISFMVPDNAERSVYITGGNHFKYYARRRHSSENLDRIRACFTAASTAYNLSWPVMFKIPAGSHVKMVLKNGYSKSTQRATNTGTVQFGLRDTTDTWIVGFGSSNPISVQGATTLNFDEMVHEATISQDTTVGCVGFYMTGTAQAMYVTVEFDFELYINGVRYI